MSGKDKVKKRVPLYLSKMDVRVTAKIKKEASKRGVAPWLLVEILLKESLGLGDSEPTSILFKD